MTSQFSPTSETRPDTAREIRDSHVLSVSPFSNHTMYGLPHLLHGQLRIVTSWLLQRDCHDDRIRRLIDKRERLSVSSTLR